MSEGIRAFIAACIALVAPTAWAQDLCRVIDEELLGAYQGGCRKGLAEGHGVATGLARYEGEFRRGLKHGHGVKTWPWGDRYEGTFVDNQKQGRGVYTWGEGSRWRGERYEGEFYGDRRNGWGVYTWPNGDRYEGAWKDDVRMGYSVMELRRNGAQKAQLVAFRPGVTVCRLGDSASAPGTVKGTVETLDGASLTVRLSQVPDESDATRPELAVGSAVTEDVVDWAPCL